MGWMFAWCFFCFGLGTVYGHWVGARPAWTNRTRGGHVVTCLCGAILRVYMGPQSMWTRHVCEKCETEKGLDDVKALSTSHVLDKIKAEFEKVREQKRPDRGAKL